MNEVKLSTVVKPNASKLVLKLDPEALGLDWNLGNIVRVKSYKKEGRLVLKVVGKKVSKTVCHKLTATGGNPKKHPIGVAVNFRKNRFKSNFAQVQSVEVAVRKTGRNKDELEVFLPNELFVKAPKK